MPARSMEAMASAPKIETLQWYGLHTEPICLLCLREATASASRMRDASIALHKFITDMPAC